MRFITNRYGKIFELNSWRAPLLNSHLKKFDYFDMKFRSKTLSRTFSSEPNISLQNLCQEVSNTPAKVESSQLINSVRNLLYPETDDEIINKLKSCINLDDVMQIINANESLNHQQLNQVVLVLRDLQQLHDICQEITEANQQIRQLHDSPLFHKLLSLIEANIDKMDATEMSCCLLYLNKLGVNYSEPVMVKLIDACEKSIFETDKNLVLYNLSRFFIAIKEKNNIWSLYTMNLYLPFLIESLDTCDNHDNFRHITVCFQKCLPLLNRDIMKKYIAKLDIALRQDDENDDISAKTRMILKAIELLNFRYWRSSYVNEVRQLLTAMKGKSHHLYFNEIAILHKAVVTLQEPIFLMREITEIIENWMNTYQNNRTPIPIFEFQTLLRHLKRMANVEMKNYLMEYISYNNGYVNHKFNHFYDVYEFIFTSNLKLDTHITSAFWSLLINLLKTSQEQNNEWFLEQVTWTIHKYILLIGPQTILRNHDFERSLVSLIVEIIRNENFIYGPAEYSKFYLTILALSHRNPFYFLTDAVWKKLLECLSRLNMHDTFSVSLILNFAYDRFKKKQHDLSQFLHYYVSLNSVANANTLNNLRRNPDLTAEELNIFLNSHILTKGIKTSEVFVELCKRFRHIKTEQLHSKIIRDGVSNFHLCDHLIPEYTDTMIEYCIKERNAIFGDIAANVLNYCFLFGYVPNKIDEFLPIAISLIDRDKQTIPMTRYLQSAISLSYFGELPSAWSDYIFNIKFLEELDEYSNKLYFKRANKLRRELMELNRVVCIDYPDREVPWFHAKFCQEMITLERQHSNDFLKSVLNITESLVGTKEAIDMSHVTPYGHKIDLVLYLSKDGQPINIDNYDRTKLRKIALILRSYSPTTYCKGKGKFELFSRQLEMLNFEVIPINRQEWNSMYLSTTQEKTNYLRKLIWPK